MADGDILLATPGRLVSVLQDAVVATGTTNGVWVDCREYVSGVVTVIGATGAAVIEIDGYNDPRSTQPPSNATTGVKLTAAALAAGTDVAVFIATLPMWIKARVATLGTGTVTTILMARGYPV